MPMFLVLVHMIALASILMEQQLAAPRSTQKVLQNSWSLLEQRIAQDRDKGDGLMGFFSRNKPVSLPPAVVRPVVVQSADLPGFSARLDVALRGMGGPYTQMAMAIQALSESVGGFQTLSQEGMRILQESGRESLLKESQRPWHWFAQACELANEQGDHQLPLRVFMFAAWHKNLQHTLTQADFHEMWLEPSPPKAYRTISHEAAEAIAHFPDDQLVAQTATEVVSVGMLRPVLEAASAT